MKTHTRIHSTLWRPYAAEITSHASIMPMPKPNRAGFPAPITAGPQFYRLKK